MVSIFDYVYEEYLSEEPDLENEADPESELALENFLQTMGIKNSKDILALKDSSLRTKTILKRYCSNGNRKVRTNKVLEFYKCLDWIPFKEMDLCLLEKFSPEDKKILLKDIQIYLNKKEEKLSQSSKWRKEYKERIWTYYKQKVPAKIKQELEHMRDYELNMVGHDRNWQFYFGLKSFKKIDEFLKLSLKEKEDLYLQFKKDVITYKNNRDFNLNDSELAYNKSWDDDIIKSINWESPNARHNSKNQQQKSSRNYQEIIDHKILGVNVGVDRDTLKHQYRKLAKIYHPDSPSGDEQKMKKIIEAYQRLIEIKK